MPKANKSTKENAKQKEDSAQQKDIHGKESGEHAKGHLLKRSVLDDWAKSMTQGAQSVDRQVQAAKDFKHNAVNKVKESGKKLNQGAIDMGNKAKETLKAGAHGTAAVVKGAGEKANTAVKATEANVKQKANDIKHGTGQYINNAGEKVKQDVSKVSHSAEAGVNKLENDAKKGFDLKWYEGKLAQGLETGAGNLRRPVRKRSVLSMAELQRRHPAFASMEDEWDF